MICKKFFVEVLYKKNGNVKKKKKLYIEIGEICKRIR